MGGCYDVKKNNKRTDKVTRNRNRETIHGSTPRASNPFFSRVPKKTNSRPLCRN
jgi:hypothetical protein